MTTFMTTQIVINVAIVIGIGIGIFIDTRNRNRIITIFNKSRYGTRYTVHDAVDTPESYSIFDSKELGLLGLDRDEPTDE